MTETTGVNFITRHGVERMGSAGQIVPNMEWKVGLLVFSFRCNIGLQGLVRRYYWWG